MDNQTRPRISISELRNRARSKARSQRVLEQVFSREVNDHRRPHVLHDVIETKAQSQSEVKVERKLQRSVTLPLSSADKRTSDHRAPHVPPEEIALEVQNHSEVKVEPQSLALWLFGQDQINVSLAAKGTSDFKTCHVPPDGIALVAGKQSVIRPMNEKTTKWVLLITSVLLEAMSAVFDQVGYALMGMVISLLALFLSGLHLIWKARKEGVKRSQPSGDLLDYYGLAAAVWQCFYSTMDYLYTRKNQQNPIKICLLPFIFALFVLLFSLFKCRT
ncbi:hypothetical protein OIU76_008663 [Salix suchowensis]|nr:verprolin [Salix suchowensis]KAJ6329880.1 hypothetical protein OIU76_008663 [Salix suchowensis]KAJ6361223.1 hypothetical protein OIU78_001795 [Salix suchowensis]